MWYQVAAAAVSAYGKYKSRPEKAEYEKLSPIEQGNIQRGEGMVKRHRFFQTRLHGKMVEHIESKGVKNQLEGISRADIAQASGELSYEKARDVKGNIAATEAEAGLKVDIGQIAKKGDLGKVLGYVNALSGVSDSQYTASTQLARGESASLLNQYENQIYRKGTKYGFAAQTIGYASGSPVFNSPASTPQPQSFLAGSGSGSTVG
jgi:hypothetical protein